MQAAEHSGNPRSDDSLPTGTRVEESKRISDLTGPENPDIPPKRGTSWLTKPSHAKTAEQPLSLLTWEQDFFRQKGYENERSSAARLPRRP
jgi:hypothetical protein